MLQLNCASPEYLAAHGTPQSLQDLASHQLIHYVPTLGARSPGWEYEEGGELRRLPMPGAVTVNNSDAYSSACLAGLGLIQAPAIGVRGWIEQGRLVEVLPAWRAPAMPVSLLYAHRRNLPRRVQAFMAWLAGVLGPMLEPLAPPTPAQAGAVSRSSQPR